MSKEEKNKPIAPSRPPLRSCPQDARLVVEGGATSSLLPALCWEGLTRRLLAPRRQRAFKLNGVTHGHVGCQTFSELQ